MKAAQSVEAGGSGARPEQQRCARGGADGLVAIGQVEAQAARREAVDGRRDGEFVAVAAKRGLEVIDEEEKDVGLVRGEGGGEEGEEKEEGFHGDGR